MDSSEDLSENEWETGILDDIQMEECMREAEDDYDDLMTTAYANARNFLSIMGGRPRASADFYVSLRASLATAAELSSCLDFELDLDGVVVELKAFSDLRIPFRYFKCLPKSSYSPGLDEASTSTPYLRTFPVLKKHLDLRKYSKQDIACMSAGIGMELISDSGWQVLLALVKIPGGTGGHPSSGEETRRMHESFCLEFKACLTCVTTHLKSPGDMGRNTVKKNPTDDVSRWSVLPPDRTWFLSLLDQALAATAVPAGFSSRVLCFSFGERNQMPLELSHHFDTRQAVISVHAAATVSGEYGGWNLLWSKEGIQEVVGERGSIFRSLGLNETANFQSNLDGRPLDISHELAQVARCRLEDLNFVQLYNDSPHLKLDRGRPVCYPVTGLIATAGMLHVSTVNHMRSVSASQFRAHRENAKKLVFPMKARLEVVVLRRDVSVSSRIVAQDLVSVPHLQALFRDHAMLIPVCEHWRQYSFSQCLGSVATSMCDELEALAQVHGEEGSHRASWKALQLEMALSLFFYGRVPAAQHLTAGLVSTRNGMLELEEVPVPCVGETDHPPLSLWTHDAIQQERIQRILPFCNHMSSRSLRLAALTVEALLKDLIQDARRPNGRQYESNLQCLRSPGGGTLMDAGPISAELLAARLAGGVFRYPLCFGRILELLKKKDLNLEWLIVQGVKQMKLYFFPAFRMSDYQKNRNVFWMGQSAYRLKCHTTSSSTSYDAWKVTEDIVKKLVSGDYMWRSRLEFVDRQSVVLPWINAVMTRLEGTALDEGEKENCLLFVSCLAFLGRGHFVHYAKVIALLRQLSVSQKDLQDMEILSNSQLCRCQDPITKEYTILYKVRQDINISIATPPIVNSMDSNRDGPKMEMEASAARDLPHPSIRGVGIKVGHELEEENCIRETVHYVSQKHSHTTWSSKEVEIASAAIAVHGIHQGWSVLHDEYTLACQRAGIPSRSRAALRSKFHRISWQQ